MHQPWAEKPIQKDNLIILGPTGTGKTESVRTAIRELNLPFPMAIVATNALSNTGYKGKNIEDVLYDLASDAKRLMSENINRYIEPGDYELAEKEDGSKVKKLNNEKTSAVVKMLCEHEY